MRLWINGNRQRSRDNSLIKKACTHARLTLLYGESADGSTKQERPYIPFKGYTIFGVFLKTLSPNLKKTGPFFQVSIPFHPLYPWLQRTKNSFSALQWSLATKLQYYILVFIDARTSLVFWSLIEIAWQCPNFISSTFFCHLSRTFCNKKSINENKIRKNKNNNYEKSPSNTFLNFWPSFWISSTFSLKMGTVFGNFLECFQSNWMMCMANSLIKRKRPSCENLQEVWKFVATFGHHF